ALECHIPQGPGQGEGALAHLDGAWQVACTRTLVAHMSSNPAQPVRVAQGLGEPLCLAQIREDTATIEALPESPTQAQADVNRLLVVHAPLGEMLQGHQRLLEQATASQPAERASALSPA